MRRSSEILLCDPRTLTFEQEVLAIFAWTVEPRRALQPDTQATLSDMGILMPEYYRHTVEVPTDRIPVVKQRPDYDWSILNHLHTSASETGGEEEVAHYLV